MSERYIFTSESVTEGHPDKMCDQISDAILDACLAQDPNSRVACETATKTGLIFLLGEITTKAKIDFQRIARNTVKQIGYDDTSKGFCYKTCSVQVAIDEQSPDINQGVDRNDGEIGAGDQGIMFGYACNETKHYMPLTIDLAHQLTFQLAKVRKNGKLPYLRPDGKSQVSIEYVDDKPTRVTTVVISTQHSEHVSQTKLRKDIKKYVIQPIIPKQLLSKQTTYYINPTGKFVIGGPQGDAGLTGRKIIVDTYGGHGAHGGGAFSGKDASKVDRSAAYMARHIAKNIVAAKLANRCLVQLSYAIGIHQPISIHLETYGTEQLAKEHIITAIKTIFPLTPKGIISYLQLTKPIFQKTACYGHFGRNNPQFTWEHLNKVKALQQYAKQCSRS
jgi:S-adenosylmethionine synthetase